MALIIHFNEMGPEDTNRMLKQSVMHQMVKQLPIHKRAAASKKYQEENEAHEKNEYGKQSDYDREALADLKEKTVKAPKIGISPADFEPDVVKKSVPDMPKKAAIKRKKP
jgi:response regulator of citrate/malate metabolism